MTITLHAPASPAAPELVLRPWRAEDADALVDVYRDPVLRQWTTVPVSSHAEARRWLADVREGWDSGHRCTFAVLEPLPDGDRLVANVVVKRLAPGREHAEVGYWTAAAARGRGIAPRALEAVTRWAFDRFAAAGLTRLDLLHQVDNPASCRVAEKTGYRFQEVLPARPPFPRDGHRHARWAGSPA
ncbi:GNAT family N-acetyltransferase [Micromonospora echinaurantiaca]|uniref:GNAT family N-acetyltransferase n=1 Tax=Micromonospora echinaurantiaca TaxID=47857 RepID=UPI000B5B0C1A|nr:GNAT family N-acetyltransferase [Micromonospora echinaurantiaca]